MLDTPTRTNRIGLAFGQFYAPHNAYHPGIDWNYGSGNQDKGQDVITPTVGVVEYVSPRGTNGGLGNYVVIYHPWHGVWTRFLHLDSVSVSVGQILARKQKIGTLGNSGTASAHLHGEVLNWKGLAFIRNHFRPYGRYPTGLSKAEVLSMWIDPGKWIAENAHPRTTRELKERLAEIREELIRANGPRKLRLTRLIERILAKLAGATISA